MHAAKDSFFAQVMVASKVDRSQVEEGVGVLIISRPIVEISPAFTRNQHFGEIIPEMFP